MDIDFGLLLGSTNDEIWNEEVDKDAGTRAVRKAFSSCKSPTCPMNVRQHFQYGFDDPERAALACKALAEHGDETPDQLMDRLIAWSQDTKPTASQPGDLGSLFEQIMSRGGPGGPRMRVVRVSPDGIEGGDGLPPQLRAMLESIFDDDPTEPPLGFRPH